MNTHSMRHIHNELQRLHSHLYAITQLGTGNGDMTLCGDDVATLLEPMTERIGVLLEQIRALTPPPQGTKL